MLKPRHTFTSVTQTLVEGLSSGTLVLESPRTEDLGANDLHTARAPYLRWRTIGIAALACWLVTVCGAAVTIRLVTQKNLALKTEVNRIAANLAEVSSATSQLHLKQLQLEAEVRLSQQQAQSLRQELRNAQSARLTSHSSSYTNPEPSVDTLTTLADIHQQAGDLTKAHVELERALYIARNDGNRREEADCLMRLGDLYRQEGNFSRAEAFLQSALQLFQMLNDTREVARALTVLGTLYKQTRREAQAQALFDQATQLLTEPKVSAGRITVINRTGAPLSISWIGPNNGRQEVADIAVLHLSPGAYRISVKARCGGSSRDLQIFTDSTNELTYSCMKP